MPAEHRLVDSARLSGGRTLRDQPWNRFRVRPVAWNTEGTAGPAQRTTNLVTLIQTIVNQGTWNSGQALAVIITGTGKRVAEAYDGDAGGAPLLQIEYTP